jgi:hypothetical protein
MICQKCGLSLNATAKQCPRCLAAVPEEDQARRAPKDVPARSAPAQAQQAPWVSVQQTAPFQHSSPAPASPAGATPVAFKKTGLGKLIFLSIVTCGAYGVWWHISQIDAYNALSSSKKLPKAFFKLYFYLCLYNPIYIAISLFIKGVYSSGGELGSFFFLVINLQKYLVYPTLLCGVLFIIFSMRTCNMLDEHYNKSLNKGIPISKALGFIFNIFYFQYKINAL